MTATAPWSPPAPVAAAPAAPVQTLRPTPELSGTTAERLLVLVAPANGRFAPAMTTGRVEAGGVVAHVAGPRGRSTPVRSPVAAVIRGLLLRPGQLVTHGQALTWAVVAEDLPA